VETTSRNGFSSLFFTHDGTSIVYSHRGGPLIIQGLLSNGGPMTILQINRPGYSPTDWAALSGTLSNCGRFAACATKHKSIAIWDVESKILLAHIPYEQFNEPIILFAPDSKGLVIGGLNGIQIQCWNIGSLSKSRSNRNATKHPLSQLDASRTLDISVSIKLQTYKLI
jgi:WD40 repeat protein